MPPKLRDFAKLEYRGEAVLFAWWPDENTVLVASYQDGEYQQKTTMAKVDARLLWMELVQEGFVVTQHGRLRELAL